jgi:hypothetical protein
MSEAAWCYVLQEQQTGTTVSAGGLSSTGTTHLQLVWCTPEKLRRVQHTAQQVDCSLRTAVPEARHHSVKVGGKAQEGTSTWG